MRLCAENKKPAKPAGIRWLGGAEGKLSLTKEAYTLRYLFDAARAEYAMHVYRRKRAAAGRKAKVMLVHSWSRQKSF
jgi:hypothetical protein